MQERKVGLNEAYQVAMFYQSVSCVGCHLMDSDQITTEMSLYDKLKYCKEELKLLSFGSNQ